MSEPTTRIWLVSDTHFGHNRLIEWGDRHVFFMEDIAKNLFNHMQEQDILLHLGDVCIGKEQHWHNEVFKQLPGTKILVRGNHDHRSDTWYRRNGWTFVCEEFQNTYFGKHCIFTHQPMITEEIPHCSVNIHGHMHNRIGGQLSERHLLVSMERTEMQPILLRDFLGV